jgi:hypothetical protein
LIESDTLATATTLPNFLAIETSSTAAVTPAASGE